MAVIHNLDQDYVDTQLVCPPDKSQFEVVDPQRTGLYIEVRANVPHGTYYVRYKDHEGKTARRRIGRTNEVPLEEARASAVRLKAAARSEAGVPLPVATKVPHEPAPIPTIASGSALTLDAFMTDFYFPHAKVHKRSHVRDEQLWRIRIKPKFGHLPLTGITRLAVQQFQTALIGEGLSNSSVNHHVQLLRRVCNLAVSWEMLERNALTRIKLLTLDNQVDRYLDEDQVTALVKVLKEDNNRMVCLILTFLLATGARLNEALMARWDQVDVENGIWKVPAADSKSKKAKHLPLNVNALWVIDQLRTEGVSDLLFPSPATGKPFTTITRQWYRIRAKAGIPSIFRIHDLRHTFASRMVSAGRSLFEVQKLLGHADSRTSQRYAHLAMKSAQEASNAAAFSIVDVG